MPQKLVNPVSWLNSKKLGAHSLVARTLFSWNWDNFKFEAGFESEPINCKSVTLATRPCVKSPKYHDMVLVLKRSTNESSGGIFKKNLTLAEFWYAKWKIFQFFIVVNYYWMKPFKKMQIRKKSNLMRKLRPQRIARWERLIFPSTLFQFEFIFKCII
jgi:hypothetical protein